MTPAPDGSTPSAPPPPPPPGAYPYPPPAYWGGYGPQRPPGRPGSFWVAILLGVLLLASAFLNFVLFAAAVASLAMGGAPVGADGVVGAEFRESTVAGDVAARRKVLVVSLSGLIFDGDVSGGLLPSEGPVQAVRRRLAAARKDPNVVGVILEIDSPGGGVTASDLIHREIAKFRAERRVPVAAWMKDVAASGGYYAAAACDRIFATPTTITGSIGVVLRLVNYGGLYEKVGLEDVTIVPDETPFKDMGSPTRPMRPEERAKFDSIVTQMYERFVDVVKAGRPALTEERVRELANGEVMTGEDAAKAGLVDEIGYLEDALAWVRLSAEAPDAKCVRWSPHPTFLQSLLGASAEGPAAAAGASLMERLRSLGAARLEHSPLLYLWTMER
jgi:protease-4